MQVDIYSVDQNGFVEMIETRNVDLRKAIGDDAEEHLDLLRREIEANGEAMWGGGAAPLYRIKPVRMDDGRREFDERVDAAIDRAIALLRPLFDKGYTMLEPWEMEILHELAFKLGCARSIIVHRDLLPAVAEKNWQHDKARRFARIAQRSMVK